MLITGWHQLLYVNEVIDDDPTCDSSEIYFQNTFHLFLFFCIENGKSDECNLFRSSHAYPPKGTNAGCMEHQLRKDRGRIHKNGEMDRRGLCIIPSSHFRPLNWFISSASLLRRKFEKIRQGFPKRSLLMEKSALLCVVLRFTRIYKNRPMTPYFVVHIFSWCFCCGSYSVMENPSNPWHNLVMISPFFWCLSAWLFDLLVPPLGGRRWRRRWRKRHVPMRSTTKTANLKQHLISPQSSLFIT